MSYYRISANARSDLEDIWVFIAQDNPEAADRLIRAVVSRFRLLASMPDMGRTREELAKDLRSLPVGNYVIFYRRTTEGVEVVRVLHGARDFPPIFE